MNDNDIVIDNEETSTRKKKVREYDHDNGFSDWGGYKAAKRAKLLDQFGQSEIKKISNIFEGVSIHVNGLTKPPINELKNLMAAHGGIFHMYQVSSTTHIIASNLPNVKIKHLGTTPIVKPSWITDSIDFGKLLDYRRYLLYTNQSKTQPKIYFPIVESTNNISANNFPSKIEQDDLTTKSDQFKPEGQNKKVSTVSETEIKSLRSPSSLTKISTPDQRFPTKTASDPKFLEEFYNNSRLHLISTLGAEFKQFVGQMRDNSDGKFPGIDKLTLIKGPKSGAAIQNTVVMHIDMDCFFVSVSLRNHPDLKGKPVAITHARNGQIANVRPNQKAAREQEFSLYSERLPVGVSSRVDNIDTQASMSEIASCSYEARTFGIRNGMFLGQAVKMCADLKTLPYDFEGIKKVSHELYKTIASYTLDIEAVSCDEMYVDITKVLRQTGLSVEEWATYIRKEIFAITGCPCSTGFGANRLQARLATRKAKPEGQYYLKPEDVENYMVDISLSDLPGVGKATLAKLKKIGLYTCGDVQLASLKAIQSEIGQKAGETLKEQSMGIDNKPLNFHHERKSVSADVNYGIRFKTIEECYTFLHNLSTEVSNRMNDINVRARCLTLKLLVRAPEAPIETAKFLGHGICNSLTKSTASNLILDSPQIIFKEAKMLYEKLAADFVELRGVGLQLTKLEKNAPVNNALSNFLKQPKDDVKQNDENNKHVVGMEQINKKEKCNNSIDVEPDNMRQIITHEEKDKNRVSTEKQKETKMASTGGRRGRPKGSKNINGTRSIKSSGSSSVDINRYFGKTKKRENVAKSSQGIQDGDKIDVKILNELPEDIRQEIIKEYNLVLNIETTQKEKINPVRVSRQHTELVTKKELAPQYISTDAMAQKSPFTNLTWDEIKPVIRKWIDSEDSPFDTDTEMIAEHFKQLAIDRKIEVLMRVFNYLYRTFLALNCTWHGAYLKMVNITQEGMVARYGRTLLVNRQFDCCNS